MTHDDLIQCPVCGSYDLIIRESVWVEMQQTARGLSKATPCYPGNEEILCLYCPRCESRWRIYDRTVSQFAGEFVDERLAILMRQHSVE